MFRRLVRDIAETEGGHGNSKSATSSSSKSRIGRRTRERVRAVATADGGLELEVRDEANATSMGDTTATTGCRPVWFVDAAEMCVYVRVFFY